MLLFQWDTEKDERIEYLQQRGLVSSNRDNVDRNSERMEALYDSSTMRGVCGLIEKKYDIDHLLPKGPNQGSCFCSALLERDGLRGKTFPPFLSPSCWSRSTYKPVARRSNVEPPKRITDQINYLLRLLNAT